MCKKNNFLCNRTDLNVDNYSGISPVNTDISHSGGSDKQLAHYAQLQNGGSKGQPVFRPFDYGRLRNLIVYRQAEPPEWLFDDFITPLNLVVGGSDYLATKDNADVLISRLPKNIDLTTNVIDGWGHTTCLHPTDPQPLFDVINKALNLE